MKLLQINIKFIIEEPNVKHANITTLYHQYLIRNHLQKILKFQATKLGIVRSNDFWNEGVGAQGSGIMSRADD